MKTLCPYNNLCLTCKLPKCIYDIKDEHIKLPRKKYSKQYYLKNREHMIIKNSEYNKRNEEKIKKYRKQYYLKNKEKLKKMNLNNYYFKKKQDSK